VCEASSVDTRLGSGHHSRRGWRNAIRIGKSNNTCCDSGSRGTTGLEIRPHIRAGMESNATTSNSSQPNDSVHSVKQGDACCVGPDVSEVTPMSHRTVRKSMRNVTPSWVCEMTTGGRTVLSRNVSICVNVDAVKARS